MFYLYRVQYFYVSGGDEDDRCYAVPVKVSTKHRTFVWCDCLLSCQGPGRAERAEVGRLVVAYWRLVVAYGGLGGLVAWRLAARKRRANLPYTKDNLSLFLSA